MHKRKKILFICKKHHLYGQHYFHENKCSGLFNSASFVANYLQSKGHDVEVINVNDSNDIDRVVTEFNPKIVILEALWVTPDKMNELLKISRHQKRLWIVRIHSKLTFLACEGMAFQWLDGYRDIMKTFNNFKVAPNTPELNIDLDETFKLATIYLPNVYMPRFSLGMRKTDHHHQKAINIGCFGAIRPMKNTLAQAMAAVKFANRHDLALQFHVNAGRLEQNGENVLKNLRAFFGGLKHHILVEHPWMDYKEFVQLVRTMDIGMQVSLCETFNIVSADFVSSDIPLVGSKEISWLPKMFCADVTSTDDIADHLTYAWTQPGYMLRHLSEKALNAYNLDAEQHWNKMIEHW